MKKIIVVLLFAIIPMAATAQDAAFKQDVQKLMKTIGVPDRIDATREYQAMWVPPDQEKAHMEKVDATIPEFLQNTEDYFLKTYTHEEVKELLAFYESPLGKKVTANVAKQIAAYNEADDVWGDTFYEVFFKYMKDRKKAVTE